MPEAVDTRSAQRRDLSFATIADALADAERLHQGGIRLSGNWTFGQILDHLAKSIEANVKGIDARPPLPLRPVLFLVRKAFSKMIVRRMTTAPMTPGVKLPSWIRPAFAPADDPDADTALDRYRTAVESLNSASAIPPHPIFGAMSPTQAEQLHCRHAELHLSFAHPAG